MNLNLYVSNETIDQDAPGEDQFRSWITHTLENKCQNAEISLTIVDTDMMTRINNDSRGINRPTNTLAFSYSEDNPNLPLFGDIFMCAVIIEQEASELGIESIEHWAHLAIHSTLHLLGYDHIDDKEAHTMESLETSIMKKLGYANPYPEGDD